MDIVTFLNARLDEDERAALEAAAFYDNDPQDVSWCAREGVNQNGFTNVWLVPNLGVIYDPASGHHIVRHSPARVLRRVQANRKLLAWCTTATGLDWSAYNDDRPVKDHIQDLATNTAINMALKAMAAPYDEHPDFNPRWLL